MQFDKSLLSGSTALLVLSLLGERDMYGYEMVEELARRSSNAFQMKEGTLYPILHGLEKDRHLTSYRQLSPGGRERKYYRLTKSGKKLLEDKREEWDCFSSRVNQVLSGGANAMA